MKTTTIFIAIVFILISSNAIGQADTSKSGWSSEERHRFIKECVNSAKTYFSEDSARSYCYCMQEKIEAKYATAKDADQITADDLQAPEMQQQIKQCFMQISKWAPADRTSFMNNCTASAKSLGETTSKNYCSCILYKLETLYPDPDKLPQITEELLQTPEWQKRIKACLAF